VWSVHLFAMIEMGYDAKRQQLRITTPLSVMPSQIHRKCRDNAPLLLKRPPRSGKGVFPPQMLVYASSQSDSASEYTLNSNGFTQLSRDGENTANLGHPLRMWPEIIWSTRVTTVLLIQFFFGTAGRNKTATCQVSASDAAFFIRRRVSR